MARPFLPLHLARPFDPTHRFETSWLVSPRVLFFIRALLSLYAFTTLLFNIGFTCAREHGLCVTAQNSFSFFTVLSYWGLAFYFAISAFHTFQYSRRQKRGYQSASAPLNRFPRPLQWLHSALYSTITTFPFLVLIVFWAILASSDPTVLSTPYSAWSNISQHILNAVFAFTEIILPRTAPVPWDHLPLHLLLLALYLSLAYLTHATKGFYTYAFLNVESQGAFIAAYVFGIAVAAVVLFIVVQGLIWLRLWVTEEKLGMRGVGVVDEHAGGYGRTGDGDVENGVVGSNGNRRHDKEGHEMEALNRSA